MHNYKISSFLLLTILVYAIVISCARPQAPTGGPKDEDPPELIDLTPKQESLNFKGNSISLNFNEYVQLNKLKTELNVTPNINEDYEYKIKKTAVILSKLQLEDSTTYTFNFGEGVVDITEKNPAENLIVIFSTGNFLDSLNISGKVNDILTGKPLDKGLVALYDVNDTLDIFSGRAKYTVKTNETGNFNFTNLKNGKYFLYVTGDNNKNFKCEPDKETFGYYQGEIDLNQPLDSIKLYTRKRNFKPFKITNLRNTGKYYEIRTNKYISEYNLINPKDTTQIIYSNKVDENKNIRIYNTLKEVDSIQLHLQLYDTIQQEIDTLFYLKFQESNRTSPDFNLSLKDVSLKPDNIFRAKLVGNKPILHLNPDSIYIQYDSLTLDALKPDTEIVWNKQKTSFEIKKQLNPDLLKKQEPDSIKKENKPKRRVPGKESFSNNLQNNNITFNIKPGSIISVENDSSTLITENLQFTKTVNFAIINFELITTETHFIAQLSDKSDNIVEEIKNQKQFSFIHLLPGEYKLRVLIDANQNGKWDEGTVKDFILPEPVYHLDKTINIRANWEVNETVTIPPIN